MIPRSFFALSIFIGSATTLGAQTGRTYTAFRQWNGEDRLDTQIYFRSGSLRVALGQPHELYRAELRYDGQTLMPTTYYDTTMHRLMVGFPMNDQRNIDIIINGRTVEFDTDIQPRRRHGRSSATVALPPKIDAPMTLVLVDADVDLGTLRTPAFTIKSATGQTTVRFSEPNSIPCQQLSIKGGGVHLSLLELGNSRCEKIKLQGGVGELLLDFSGAWQSNASVWVTVAAGQLTLRFPSSLGVQIRENAMLTGIDLKDFTRDGDRYRSANYATALRHLDIDISAVISAIDVEWLAR